MNLRILKIRILKIIKQDNLKRISTYVSLIVLISFLIHLQKIQKDVKVKKDRQLQNLFENYNKPILFLCGAPRSGLKVLKDLLNSNGLASCSEPNPILPKFLSMVIIIYNNKQNNIFFSLRIIFILKKTLKVKDLLKPVSIEVLLMQLLKLSSEN